MISTGDTAGAQRERALRATALIAGGGAAAFVIVPLLSPVLLVGCVLIPVLWTWYEGDRQRGYGFPRWLIALGAFVAWMGLSALWSPARGNALWATFGAAILLMASWRALALADHWPRQIARRIEAAFVLAVLAAVWLTLHEQATGMGLKRLLMSFLPITRPGSAYVKFRDGWAVSIEPFTSNKNIAAAVLLAWPAMLLSRGFATTPPLRLLRAVTIAALVAGVFMSNHETSKLAIVASALAYAAAGWRRDWVHWAMVAAWIAATLLVVPIVLVLYNAELHRAGALQHSGQHRIVIWGLTAQSTLKQPVIGHGLAATRAFDEMTPQSEIPMLPGTRIKAGINVHSHNVFLQVWHELGAVGAVLLMLAGLPLLAWLRRLPDATGRHLCAAWVVGMVIAGLSWSLIAPWFQAAFGFAACWARFAAARVVEEHGD
jgi:hypothetical protein